MRYLFLLGISVLLLCVAGCQRKPDAQPVTSVPQPENSALVQEAAKEGDLSIGVSDLLDALEMEVWKARVNEDVDQYISTVSLSTKQKESDPNTVLTLDIPDDRPGTLLVYLQDLPARRDRMGIVYHGDDGRSSTTSNVVDDPFTDVVGVKQATSAHIGRRGVIVLRSSGDSDIGKPETVAIFLNNE